jgi:hypothetical protein
MLLLINKFYKKYKKIYNKLYNKLYNKIYNKIYNKSYNKIYNKILSDNKAQVSVEFLLILGILILGAIVVGYYLKQSAVKNANKSKDLQKISEITKS